MRFEPILEWFGGKALDKIVSFAIPALLESEQLGYWKKGTARSVKAALNKQTVAQKWARKVENEFGSVSFGQFHLSYTHPLYEAHTNFEFGKFERASKLRATLAKTTFSDAEKPYAEDARRWADAFEPIADLVARLDVCRPKAVVVMKTLSLTVAKTVGEHIGLDFSTIQSPPSHSEWIEVLFKGQKVRMCQIIIDWPMGTIHNASRFHSTNNNDQCQACGHAIQDPYNWIPILAYNDDKVPHSLWVGRDCAKKLFGCEVEGDAIYKGRV